jgi:4-hydroxyphenylpyruvate dioxygenase-like putative hemolysin
MLEGDAMQNAAQLGLGPIDQVSYVVEDLEKALPHYEAIYGTFQLAESPLTDCTIRGAQADCVLKLAINNSGPLEIELIQVVEGSTSHSEHLRAHGEGLHHVRFRVQGLDAKLEELEKAGFETVFYKRFGPTVGFAYLETPPQMGGSVIELLELP